MPITQYQAYNHSTTQYWRPSNELGKKILRLLYEEYYVQFPCVSCPYYYPALGNPKQWCYIPIRNVFTRNKPYCNSTKLQFAMDVNRISITEHVFHLLQYFNVFTQCTICQKHLSFSCLFTYRSAGTNPFCRISIAHWSNGTKLKNVFTLLKHYWCFSANCWFISSS